jgi:hypothetical protein
VSTTVDDQATPVGRSPSGPTACRSSLIATRRPTGCA